MAGNLQGASSFDAAVPYAAFGNPARMATDSNGNVYILDGQSAGIRKLQTDGTVTTIPLTPGFSDYVPPAFFSTDSIAIDKAGNIFLASVPNRQIYRVAPDGKFTVFAGKFDEQGVVDGPRDIARFHTIVGMAFDQNDNLYIADFISIRKMTPDGNFSTIAGTVTIGYKLPPKDGIGSDAVFPWIKDLAMNPDGTMYVSTEDAIRLVRPNGEVKTIAGMDGRKGYLDGKGEAALFHQISAITSNAGLLYVADIGSSIRTVTAEGVVKTVAGEPYDGSRAVDGVGRAARFEYIHGMAVDRKGAIVIGEATEGGYGRLRRMDADFKVSLLSDESAAWGGGATSTAIAKFEHPRRLSAGVNGDLDVIDSGRLRQAGMNGDISAMPNSSPCAGVPGCSTYIDVKTNKQGTRYLLTYDGILKQTGSNSPVFYAALPKPGDADLPANARDASAVAMALDSQDNVYALIGNAVWKFRPDGRRMQMTGFRQAPAGTIPIDVDGPVADAIFNGVSDLVVDSVGNIYVSEGEPYYRADRYSAFHVPHVIRKISASGIVTTVAGKFDAPGFADGPAAQSRLSAPGGLAVDDKDNVYIADFENNAIRKLSPGGELSSLLGKPSVNGFVPGVMSVARISRPRSLSFQGKHLAILSGLGIALVKNLQ